MKKEAYINITLSSKQMLQKIPIFRICSKTYVSERGFIAVLVPVHHSNSKKRYPQSQNTDANESIMVIIV